MNTNNDIIITKKYEKLEHNLNSLPFSDNFIQDESGIIFESNVELFNKLLNNNSIKNYEIEKIYL